MTSGKDLLFYCFWNVSIIDVPSESCFRIYSGLGSRIINYKHNQRGTGTEPEVE